MTPQDPPHPPLVIAETVRDWPAYAVHLRGLLSDVVVAADRLLDDYNEADKDWRRKLRQDLYEATTAAADEVYPLAQYDGGGSDG
jgi:hypothetical protein